MRACTEEVSTARTRVEAYEQLSGLPPFHPAAVKLMSIAAASDSVMSDFEDVFRSDPALTADLLLMANSAAFGLRARVQGIRHALTLLGLERVRALASSAMLVRYLRKQRLRDVEPVWRHSIASAVIAERLGAMYNIPGMYTMGLLHDLGRLGLLLSKGEQYAEALVAEVENIGEAMEIETTICGMDHCDAGALLARTWGFPEILQLAMVRHHRERPQRTQTSVDLLQIACQMAGWLGFPEVRQRSLHAPQSLPQRIVADPQLDPKRVVELIKQQAVSLA